MSTHSSTEIFSYPPKLLPGSHFFENVRHLFDNVDFFGSMFNSLARRDLGDVPGPVLRLAGRVRLRQVPVPRPQGCCSRLMMAIFMVPAQLQAIPQFVIMAKLGWIGSMTALIVPAAANAFGIFWMRQYMKSAIHDELIDASKLDGAGLPAPVLARGAPGRPPRPRLPRHLHLHGPVERLRLAADRPHQPRQRDPPGRAVPAQRCPWHHRLRNGDDGRAARPHPAADRLRDRRQADHRGPRAREPSADDQRSAARPAPLGVTRGDLLGASADERRGPARRGSVPGRRLAVPAPARHPTPPVGDDWSSPHGPRRLDHAGHRRPAAVHQRPDALGRVPARVSRRQSDGRVRA